MSGEKIKLYQGEKLVENVLLIDGITRSGKFLLGNVLQGIEGIEHYQYFGILEHIPFLVKLNMMEVETAKAIIRCQIDNFTYDHMVGRNLNFRKIDKSSIYNVPNVKRYLDSLEKEDDGDAMKIIQNPDTYFPFIAHETLPNIAIYFDIYPKLKVVHIERNPIDLTYSWYKRGLGKRWANDPKLFTIAIEGPKGPRPWFFCDLAEDYENLPEIDRVIHSISNIVKMSKKSYDDLNAKQKGNIFFISYEGLLSNIDDEVGALAGFFGKQINVDMEVIRQREKLPKENPRSSRSSKLAEIKKLADKESIELLLTMEEEYSNKKSLIK